MKYKQKKVENNIRNSLILILYLNQNTVKYRKLKQS